MTFYNLYIFDRHCKCVYYTSWHKVPSSSNAASGKLPPAGTAGAQGARTSSSAGPAGPKTARSGRPGGISLEEESKLVYGVIYSLRNMVNKLKASSDLGSFLSYRTVGCLHNRRLSIQSLMTVHFQNAYRLHYFETATGLKFVLNTDPGLENMSNVLRTIYSQMYVEYVAKNPLSKLDSESIGNDLFRQSVDRYVAGLPGFQ